MALAISDNSAAAARALFEIAGGQQNLDGSGKNSGASRLCTRIERERSGSMRPRHRSPPGPDEAATVPAAAFVRARSRACTPLRPSRIHREAGGSRRGGRTPHPPPAGNQYSQASCASCAASFQLPRNCKTSAR